MYAILYSYLLHTMVRTYKNMVVLLLSGLKSTMRHKWHACHRVILLRVI